MGSGFIEKTLDYTKKKKRWIMLLGLIGFSSYGTYKVYHMPSVARNRKRILTLLRSLFSIAEMVNDSAETVALVSRDLKEFLNSDSDEIPLSLKQLSKIALSEEFSKSVITVSQAMTIGILRGCKGENYNTEINGSSFSDRFVDKLISSAGTEFVSVIVGSFAKNLVLGLYENSGMNQKLSENSHFGSSSSLLPFWVRLLFDDRCKVLVTDCITTFVSTLVAVYLDKTLHINFIDDLLCCLTDPKHQNKVTDILVTLCNGAVETLVRTSHEILTASNRDPIFRSNCSVSIVDDTDKGSVNETRKKMSGYSDLENKGWFKSVSSTLAVPSNRRFVLDVTGRVTFETVRSMMILLWSKICETMKTNVNVMRGFEVVSYVGAKSSVILTVCLALILHIIADSRILVPW